MDSKQIIEKIDGLNSTSTLNRWRKLAETLCNVEFEKNTIRTGEKSYTKVYQYSHADLEKFQHVAELRNKGQPMNEAIKQAFLTKAERQRNETILVKIGFLENCIQTVEKNEEQMVKLINSLKSLDKKVVFLGQKNYQLEQRLEQIEKQKMDKPFSKKRS